MYKNVKAQKDLFMHGAKEPSFKKGKIYPIVRPLFVGYLHNNILLIDEQGDEHYMGSFFTNFKLIR